MTPGDDAVPLRFDVQRAQLNVLDEPFEHDEALLALDGYGDQAAGHIDEVVEHAVLCQGRVTPDVTGSAPRAARLCGLRICEVPRAPRRRIRSRPAAGRPSHLRSQPWFETDARAEE